MTKIQQRIKNKVGSKGRTAEINGILVVHFDNPKDRLMNARHCEVLNGLVLDNDCPLCKEMAKRPPEAVIFDGETVMYISRDDASLFIDRDLNKKKGS